MNRIAKLAVVLGIVAFLGIGLGRLQFDVDVLNLLPADLPAVRGLKLYQEHFSTAQELIVVVHSADADYTESAARALTTAYLRPATNLVREARWQPPWQEQPRASAELVAYLWFNSPPETFAALADRLTPEKLPALLTTARNRLATSLSPNELAQAGYDPFGLLDMPPSIKRDGFPTNRDANGFASEDGTWRAIFVQPAEQLSDYRAASTWLQEVQGLVRQWRGAGDHHGIEIRYTGGPAFMTEISRSMQQNIRNSVLGTMLVIAVLFWWAHRRFAPLLWLISLLAMVLLGTLAAGGMLFHTINVVSMGFAAMLLGLAADYGLVLYQESQAEPQKPAREINRELAPGIIWSAVTTAGAFSLLSLGGLPGLMQLGWLVAIGMILAAAAMLFGYLAPLKTNHSSATSQSAQPTNARAETPEGGRQASAAVSPALIVTGLLLIIFVAVVWPGLPRLDHSTAALRPRNIQAYDTFDEIKLFLGQQNEPLWLVVTGQNESEIAQRLAVSETALQSAVSNKAIAGYMLPTALWPRPDYQATNRSTARRLIDLREDVRTTALAEGFTSNSLALTENMLATWGKAVTSADYFLPTNNASRWTLDKVMARTTNGLMALGLITPSDGSATEAALAPLSSVDTQTSTRTFLSGWSLLGSEVLREVKGDFARVLIPMAMLLLITLWLAFRQFSSVLLSLAALIFSLAGLLTVMKFAGWSWNLMNITALPLLLGAGIDYGLHMQLALRRHGGDIAEVRGTVGRALLLCAGTTVAAFGSLAWSTNTGLASLGRICAAGIACNCLVAVYLLPSWWRWFAHPRNSKAAVGHKSPSVLYSTALWSLALGVTKALPESWLRRLMSFSAALYWKLATQRRNIVIANCLPVLNGDKAAARHCARETLQNFAHKLVDLWRYECGLSVGKLIGQPEHWELFQQALATRRGVLIVTPHLGNWEFGAPMLIERGIPLLVVTLVEPSRGLTELRQASRARQGVETLVIGNDPFAAVEIIRRLEAGAVVALLVDRPVGNSATGVTLFGRPFSASIAAAELARASGCVLLPACMPRGKNGYAPEFYAPVEYNRAALRDPGERRKLTQEIMRAFEPSIRQHLNQWYHFVPIWPKE